MKIKSRFKDYYDYIAHMYGGGDERLTYAREPIPDDKTTIILDGSYSPLVPRIAELKAHIKWLAINGQLYTLVACRDERELLGPYKLFTEENFGHLMEELSIKFRYELWHSERHKPKWEKYFAVEDQVATEISKMIKHPVFMIDQCYYDWTTKKTRIVLNKNIPTLAEYGISHHIQPEQLYQDIAYYMSNKMVSSPDLEVHDNMTDKEKIVQHGFDLKQSFRHGK